MKIEDITVTHDIFFMYGTPEKHICVEFPINQDTVCLKKDKDFFDESCKFAIYINNYNSEITSNLVSTLVLGPFVSDYVGYWVLELTTVISL